MIKYLGSKRALVGVLGDLASAVNARTAVDLFTGTTRVAQEFCRRGIHTTAVDKATYAHVLAQCFVETDAEAIDPGEVDEALARLSALPDRRGYVTEVFCETARYFHPDNGQRIDAIREGIDELYPDSPLRPILLTSLMLAADAVDSTVGLQMAYLKNWAPRALKPLTLKRPELTPGPGAAVRADAVEWVSDMRPVDFAYLDPPYNQHRYLANYHVWETLIRWDDPEHYGVACKRIDLRTPSGRSDFNSRRRVDAALSQTIVGVKARTVAVSFNAEGFVPIERVIELASLRGDPVEVLAFDTPRHVGSIIGVYNPEGKKVGKAGHRRTTEYVVLAGPGEDVAAAVDAVGDQHLWVRE